MATSLRRRSTFAAGVVAVVGFVYACSFPDPMISESTPDGAEPAEGSAQEGGAEGATADVSATDVRSLDQQILVDGEVPEVVADAGTKIDASTSCLTSNDCDCDKDGHNRPGCGNDAGQDCDDSDQRVRPDQGFLEIPAESPRNGDWNCKNGIEKLYATKVTCGLLALGACEGVQGFEGDPGCGQEAPYIFCGVVELLPPLGLTCGKVVTQTRKQACR